MWAYVVKRLLLAIPTLIGVFIIAFFLNEAVPGNPVLLKLFSEGSENSINKRQLYTNEIIKSGLNKPVFYFSITSKAFPSNLHAIAWPTLRECITDLCQTTGNPEKVLRYINTLENTKLVFQSAKEPNINSEILSILDELLKIQTLENRNVLHQNLINFYKSTEIQNLNKTYAGLLENKSLWRHLFPKVSFHGSDNRFHIWLTKIVTFDFGTSYVNGQQVWDKLSSALGWTVAINFISLLLAYLIAIPSGVFAGISKGNLLGKLPETTFFVLYAIPGFWAATLLLVFFGGGDFLNWFPSNGVQSIRHNEHWSMIQKIQDWTLHLTLPIICFSYHAFAFLSRQTSTGLQAVLQEPYIVTAYSKGLSGKRVILKHALKNAIFPLISQFSILFPSMIAGSIILETIFSIPGMGLLTFQAISGRDYPVILGVFTLSGVLSIAGMLVGDILYAYSDPRIRFSKN